MTRGPAIVLAVTAILIGGAGVALAVSGPDRTGVRRAAEFHQLVGGLGGGPATDLSRCEAAFDPRINPTCTADGGPVPGGEFFCPYHGHAPSD